MRLASRLRAAVDGGAFVPLPFLRAADAAPAALLADIRLPHAHGGLHGALPLVHRTRMCYAMCSAHAASPLLAHAHKIPFVKAHPRDITGFFSLLPPHQNVVGQQHADSAR